MSVLNLGEMEVMGFATESEQTGLILMERR
jgi:hypothetical protein